MAYAMMKQIMLNATLMVEIVVELVSTQSIVHNVFVMMVGNLIFHVSSFLLRNIITIDVACFLAGEGSNRPFLAALTKISFFTKTLLS